MGLRGRRFDDMMEDQYRFLPHQHPDLGWAIMDPEGTNPTTQVMVHYAYELVDKNRRLEDQLKVHEATLKRYRQVIDEQRVCLNLPRSAGFTTKPFKGSSNKLGPLDSLGKQM